MELTQDEQKARIEAIAADRRLIGMPVVRVPKEYLEDDAKLEDIKNRIEQLKADLRRDGRTSVTFPPDCEYELIKRA